MVVAVIAVGAVHMAGGAVIMVIVVMVAIGAMNVRSGSLECVGHGKGLRRFLGVVTST
jgi:hypothetical protein